MSRCLTIGQPFYIFTWRKIDVQLWGSHLKFLTVISNVLISAYFKILDNFTAEYLDINSENPSFSVSL